MDYVIGDNLIRISNSREHHIRVGTKVIFVNYSTYGRMKIMDHLGLTWHVPDDDFKLGEGVPVKSWAVISEMGKIVASYVYQKRAITFAEKYEGSCYVMKTSRYYKKELIA